MPTSGGVGYNHDMKFRKLRIAWSVAWGLLTLVLCVLWAASYTRRIGAEIFVTAADRYHIHSAKGAVIITREGRIFRGRELSFHYPESFFSNKVSHSGLKVGRGPDGTIHFASISDWLLNVVTLFAATIPWLPCRFSLRTLFIATTLVAVAFGWIVWVVK